MINYQVISNSTKTMRQWRHRIFETAGGIKNNHPITWPDAPGFPLHFQRHEAGRTLWTQVQAFFGAYSGPHFIDAIVINQSTEAIGLMEYLQHLASTQRVGYAHTMNLGGDILPGFNLSFTGFKSSDYGTTSC